MIDNHNAVIIIVHYHKLKHGQVYFHLFDSSLIRHSVTYGNLRILKMYGNEKG